ncbi:FKBP-type peptidyl-prolyl cis-trans isomerase [Nocardiopsis changdeensis]|uniref:peptidylprolyl isomerase n=1 Tax=Nocardiopsis changdeensis TaxID=2831969 RepID=A0ABX8BFT3_9ACTN|nr:MULTISPECIES: FKBP-type peptidyl-prolyl cis-trans isomerase [Nocardiopsis]QUX20919.1 FKBP-type peptidyl-prolyl cis-trans isomerase [Nocardiopsis changdeensis]QYX36850.1 FKBP-type peptidyl-prolyl cis-trans isomerase [Nocardiopsis sp. MT53]
MHRRAAALAVPLTVIALTVSSCGNIPEEWRTPAFMRMDGDQLDSRLPTVTGDVGEAPEVAFPDIEPPEEELSGVVDEGPSEEELVRADDLVIANVAQFQWTGPGEGEPVEGQSSYETGAPDLIRMTDMPEQISSVLVNQAVGSRAVYVFPPLTEEEQAQAESMGQPPQVGASVLVVDILDRFGMGSVVPGEQTTDGGDGLPTVTQEGHSEPTIEIPEGDAPEELEVVPLIEGTGDEVEEGQQVIVQYTGVRWEADENGDHPVFDSTWTRGGAPFDTTIGAGSVIKGWDEGIVGQKTGSRLLLVVPGDMAYGETEEEAMGAPAGTLVFVVDVLGAFDNPPPAEPEEGASEGAEDGGEEAPADEESPEGEATE